MGITILERDSFIESGIVRVIGTLQVLGTFIMVPRASSKIYLEVAIAFHVRLDVPAVNMVSMVGNIFLVVVCSACRLGLLAFVSRDSSGTFMLIKGITVVFRVI